MQLQLQCRSSWVGEKHKFRQPFDLQSRWVADMWGVYASAMEIISYWASLLKFCWPRRESGTAANEEW
jgi:hypothetical protein